jgi:flagellar motor switch protein FliG
MTGHEDRLRKAAVLVSALDADSADALLDRLPPNQAGMIRRMLVELLNIDPREQEVLMAEFVGRPSGDAAAADGGVSLELSGSHDAAATESARDVKRPAPTFRFLQDAADEDLRELLKGERPQTVAVVVSHLPSQRAAVVLGMLPDALQADVMQRLARLDETDVEVLADVEKTLEQRFRRRLQPEAGRFAGVGAVKGMLDDASPDQRRNLLSTIARQDPTLASRLTRSTVTFADLTSLTDASLRTLCETAEHEALVVALAGGELDFTRRIASVLPRMRASRLQSAIDSLGPTRLSDVELAQDEIVHTARFLENSGRLVWLDGAVFNNVTARNSAQAA